MLTRIKVKNYKGFKDAEIPIKPITILLGANSSGKSSMLQLLSLLQQTAEESSDSYGSALKIFGKRINIGKPENMFFCRDCKTPIKIQIEFNDTKLQHIIQKYSESFNLFISYCYNSDVNDKDSLIKALNRRRINKTIIPTYIFDTYYESIVSKQDISNKNKEALIRNFDLLYTQRNKAKSNSFSAEFTISYKRKQLVISGFSIQNGDLLILSYDEGTSFSSDLISLNDTEKNQLKSSFAKKASIFNLFKPITKRSSLVVSMITIVNNVTSHLRNEFKEPIINHVGPLRAHPQRYYMLDKASVSFSLDTYDPNAIAEVIKDNEKIKNKVNEWFEKFGLKVDVEAFKEAIHKFTVYQSELDLDITDVGFGVSQVLPVVMQGFLSPENSFTIVEQPEVHLHPKMQASLADLFIDITKESKFTKNLIIETHSEYLLKRLRRRMAEGDNIKPDKVSINLFHARINNSPAIIENLEIGEKGAFKWPKDYYDDDLYDDITEFLKLQ